MGKNRIVVSKAAAGSAPSLHPPTPAAGHPILELQRQAGNRAVTALLQKPDRYPVPQSAVLAVQRQESSAGVGAPPRPAVPARLVPPPLVSERQRLAAQAAPVVNQVVDAMPPDVGPEGAEGAEVADADRAEAARQEAEAVGEDVAGLPRSPAFASWLGAQQDGEGGPAPVEEQQDLVQELEASKDEAAEPAPAAPGRLSRAGSAVKSFFQGAGRRVSGWGSSVKQALSPENRRDVGAKAPTVGGLGSPVAAHLGTAITAGQGLLDNRATEATAGVVGGAKATGEVRATAGQIGQEAHAASSPTTTLEHPGEFARSFTAGGFELAHQIASMAGIFFSALKAALDIRSLISSVRVLRGLKAARKEAAEAAAEFWPDPEASEEVVAMIDYAIRQKYQKIIKRAIGSVTALAALGTALALLIANPVGASLAAIIIGGLGASMFVYRLGRWAWKKWKTESLGKKRSQIAYKLHAQTVLGDRFAVEAVRALHLDPDVVARAPNGPALIMRKLKSA